jgi:phospholipid transport system substrate-binding protein
MEMNKMGIRVVLAMLACVIGGISGARAADQNDAAPPPTARQVMDQVTHDVLAVLRDQTLSADQKREKVKQIAYQNINFEVMARLSLGRFWRGLTDAQRTQYQQEFRQLVTNTYGSTTDSYTDEDVKVMSDRQEQDGDYTVLTRITGTKDDKPDQEVAKVDYRLRKQDDQWKVIDFTIDGVSLVANFRSQFQEVMSNGGIDQLLKLLREKNAAHEKNPANGK